MSRKPRGGLSTFFLQESDTSRFVQVTVVGGVEQEDGFSYDLAAGSAGAWRTEPNAMADPVHHAGSCVDPADASGETMLVVNGRHGGLGGVQTSTTACQRYSLAGGGPLGPCPETLFPMSGLGTCIVDGSDRVWACGGELLAADAEPLIPDGLEWERTVGHKRDGGTLANCLVLEPGAAAWRVAPALPAPRHGISPVYYDGYMCALHAPAEWRTVARCAMT